MRHTYFSQITLGLICLAIAPIAASAQSDPAAAFVTVNGDDVTDSALQLEYLSRQIPDDQQENYRDRILHELVDRCLIQQFLAKRRIEVPARDLDNQLETLRRVVAATDGDFDMAIAAMGFTPESLREHLSLPLAWKVYVRKTVTDQQLRDEFNRHRAHYDGTEVRASQIVISIPRDAANDDWAAAEQKLTGVRATIEDGTLTFADAARQHSTSPSGKDGGDVGFFPYRGGLPAIVATQAFELESGALSPVFRSPFGVHLLTVTERKAGDLSLEDVRETVLEDLSARMWSEQAAAERKKARIDWHVEVHSPDDSAP